MNQIYLGNPGTKPQDLCFGYLLHNYVSNFELPQLGIWIEYDCNWGWSVIFDEFFLILTNDFKYIEVVEEMLEEKNV